MNDIDHDKIISALDNVITTTTALITAEHDYTTALDVARDLKTAIELEFTLLSARERDAAAILDAARTAYHRASRAYTAAIA